ncbi:MAG TPA: sigma-70 family RNA polymerase sigma factor [Bacteroidales bacterium]|nr:sigma-70 family RNA polymerase sigma factor [Bacteroidales bacterium]
MINKFISDKNRNADAEKMLTDVFRTHFDSLFAYGLKISEDKELVKDCIQELFYRLWKNNTGAQNVNSMKFYLFKALRRQILNAFDLKSFQINKVSTDKIIHFEISPEDLLIQNQTEKSQRERILVALNQLSPRQREAVYLRYFEELDFRETARIMDINVQSAKNNVYRALETLKDIL